jgi:outer membrane protein assembly factor BamB
MSGHFTPRLPPEDGVREESEARAAPRDGGRPLKEWHRRRRLRALALFAAIVAVCAGCDWQMFGYGPEHTSFNPTESAISVGNVTRLVRRYPANNAQGCGRSPESWWEVCSSPVVAKGSVFFGTSGGDLVARDAGSGSLRWSAPIGAAISSPSVVDGVVYFGASATLYAFDAAGNTNCSGGPKTCAPLWTADTTFTVTTPPTIAGGVVYVGTENNNVFAFSAAGTTRCSGSPKVCSPLWSATLSSSVSTAPAVANGVVYFSALELYAFDAGGTTNCSGSPKVCMPLWTGDQGPLGGGSPPAVANGVVYVGAGYKRLTAFSAAGTTNCSGSPRVCLPLWTAPLSGLVESAPAIANGVVYISAANRFPFNPSDQGLLYAFDAAGITHCSGTPKTCTPLWTAAQHWMYAASSPAVANGVVYVTYQATVDLDTGVAGIDAFDAEGTTNCSGTPTTCSPLWSAVVAGDPLGLDIGFPSVSSPVVANGAVYLNGGALYKYSLPTT